MNLSRLTFLLNSISIRLIDHTRTLLASSVYTQNIRRHSCRHIYTAHTTHTHQWWVCDSNIWCLMYNNKNEWKSVTVILQKQEEEEEKKIRYIVILSHEYLLFVCIHMHTHAHTYCFVVVCLFLIFYTHFILFFFSNRFSCQSQGQWF